MKIVYSPRIIVRHKINASRLQRRWFYNRIFWQAVSDKIAQNPDSGARSSILARFENSPDCPPQLIEDKLSDSDDPEQFYRHCTSLYIKAQALLESDAHLAS